MMRPFVLLLTAGLVSGCGGRSATSGTAPSPDARPGGAAAEPTVVRYAPSTARYRYEQIQHATREQMGQVQTTDATTIMLISVVVATGDGGNLAVSYTIDSVSVVGSNDATGPLGGLKGKTWHAVVAPTGRLVTLTPPDSTPLTILGGEIFKDFLPILPPGNMAPGTAWTDTIRPPATTTQGATIHSVSIRNSRVVGWETRDGTRALHVATAGTYTITGEGEQGGAQFMINGTGVAANDRYVAPNGTYAGTAGTDSSNVMVDVPAAGIQIPIRQTRRATLTRLP